MIRIAGFSGEIPKMHPRLLDNNFATVAQNVKLENGAMVPIRNGRHVNRMPFDCKTIFKDNDGDWFGWETVVKVVPAPVAENRLYVTGDGVPKVINKGITYPLAVPKPPIKLTTEIVSGDIDTELSATIIYSYTWLTVLDEESEPAPLSDGLLWSPNLDVRLSGFVMPPLNRGINRMRIYRSQTGASGTTTLFLINERPVQDANYVDIIANDPLQDPLPSLTYNQPPDELQGLTALPNGMMAGFVGKSLYFSEPYRPHAWPESYILTCDYEIVGLGAFGSSVAIMTTGHPYVAQGSTPENMQMSRLRLNLPCVAAQSIVDLGYSVAYASTDGLVTISDDNAGLVTQNLISTDQWRLMAPESFIAGQFSGRYMASYAYLSEDEIEQHGMLIIDLTGQVPFLVRASDSADAVFFEIGTGVLYLLRNGHDVYEWDSISEAFGEMYWRSKLFVIPTFTNFGCLLVEGNDVTSSAQAAQQAIKDAAARAKNRALIDASKAGGSLGEEAIGITTFAGSLLNPILGTEPFFSVTIYADGKKVMTHYEMNKILRLPSKSLATQWEIEVRGNQQVAAITLAYSPEEIAGG